LPCDTINPSTKQMCCKHIEKCPKWILPHNMRKTID
jgi:hypothetical protein